MVKKYDDTFGRFDTMPACDGQTDGRTDILWQHGPRYAYASRGKKTAKNRDRDVEHSCEVRTLLTLFLA